MKRHSRPTSVPSNPELWSDESKRSYIYQSSIAEYKDIHYECWRCKKASVFTAQEQQTAYEGRKAYIWQKRTLCEECYRARLAIERDLKERSARWKEEKDVLRSDKHFLQSWLASLEEQVRYGARADVGNMSMIQGLLPPNEA